MLRIRSVVLNANDLHRSVAFWSAALGYEPVRPLEEDWATLGPAEGDGPRVSIQLSDQDPPEIPHVHLDLHVDDAAEQAAEVERLLGLGAERVDWHLYPHEPHDFVVLADPDGNRFCVIDRSFGSA